MIAGSSAARRSSSRRASSPGPISWPRAPRCAIPADRARDRARRGARAAAAPRAAARRLALGGDAGGVSGTGRPAPQAPPLHEAVGGRRRARFGARVHLPRGGRARRGGRIAEAAPSALRDGLAAQGRRAPQGRRPQPERPGQSGRPGESAKGQGLPGPLSLRPGRRQAQGRLAAAGPEVLGGCGPSRAARPAATGLRRTRALPSLGAGAAPASPRPTAARARARARRAATGGNDTGN